jgi:hypothetical protein
VTRHRDQAQVGCSEEIWHSFPISDKLRNPACAIELFDDFDNQPTMSSSTVVLTNRYAYISDTGVVINQIDDIAGNSFKGAVEFNIDSDNDVAAIQVHGGSSWISDTGGDERALWFEARVAVTQITAQSVFIGLAERDMTSDTDQVFADGGTIADISCVGFRILEADPDGWDAIHQKNGGGGEVVVKNEAQVAVATTFYKFGLVYQPKNALDGKIVRWYVDGVEVGSITSLPSTFPDAVALCPLFLCKSHAAANDVRMDWWRSAQSRF